VSSQRVNLKDALYDARKNKGRGETANPLVRDGRKLIPSVTRVFSRGRAMYVYLQAYEAAAAPGRPLLAFVAFYQGQKKAFETPPLAVADSLKNTVKTVPFEFTVALDKLPPGRYDCQVSVLDPSGQKAAFWRAPVMLVP
jgi:hypothetical protein